MSSERSSLERNDRSLGSLERNLGSDSYLSEPVIDLPELRTQPDILNDDLDFGMLWRELAGLRLDEVFAMSRFNSLFDTKTR